MADHPDAGAPKSVAIDGVPVGTLFATFECGDDLVEQLRRRAAYVGVSYGMLEHITGTMAEGAVGKYLGPRQAKKLTCASLTKIAAALGLRAVLIIDPALVRRNQEHWGGRDEKKAHPGRRRAIAAEATEHEPASAPAS